VGAASARVAEVGVGQQRRGRKPARGPWPRLAEETGPAAAPPRPTPPTCFPQQRHDLGDVLRLVATATAGAGVVALLHHVPRNFQPQLAPGGEAERACKVGRARDGMNNGARDGGGQAGRQCCRLLGHPHPPSRARA
jgi:hypothetical protein